MYSIGDVSRKVGIKVPTLRYYEQAGLIPEPQRTDGQQRRYSETDLERLTFVKHARQLGFSMASVRSLLELNESEGGHCLEVHELAEKHLARVREKLQLLSDLEGELERIVRGCDAGHVGECYVIQSMSNHELCETDH